MPKCFNNHQKECDHQWRILSVEWGYRKAANSPQTVYVVYDCWCCRVQVNDTWPVPVSPSNRALRDVLMIPQRAPAAAAG